MKITYYTGIQLNFIFETMCGKHIGADVSQFRNFVSR